MQRPDCTFTTNQHLWHQRLHLGVVAYHCDVRETAASLALGNELHNASFFLNEKISLPTSLEETYGGLIQINTQNFLAAGTRFGF